MPTHLFPEERRSATILFADVQGFTSLAERLDYETVSDLIKELWSSLDAVIEESGGYIDKHMGDGVMAIWGAPYATDRDAEKAVHAGLQMIESLNEFARNSTIQGVEKLRLRVGINSGQVFAGYVGTRNEYTVIGDTVNIAARLEQAAEPGTAIVGENTGQLIKTLFELKELPPIRAKGKAEPLKAFQIAGTRPSTSRIMYDSLDQFETHMVGRDSEMTRLRMHFEQARTSISPTLLLVTGEVGIGKSRLLMEFAQKIQREVPSAQVYSVRALAQTAHVPYNIFKQILYRIFNLQDDDSDEHNAEKLAYGIRRLWDGTKSDSPIPDIASAIGSLIGLDVNPQKENSGQKDNSANELNHAQDSVRILANQLVAKAPLILIIDDLQWADVESLGLLLFLSKPGNEPLPALVIGGTRLGLLRDYPQWWTASQLITLNPIPFTGEMVALAYPDLNSLPNHILEELANRAEGNPYFLEEIIKGLVKSGLDDLRTTPDETIAHIQSQIPESLRSMLQARLDNLTREARTVALMASVVGRVFWVGAIREIARANTGTGTLSALPDQVLVRLLQDGLRQLIRAEMAFPRAGTQFSEQQEYIFKNSYLCDVAYSMIPHRSRAIYHLAVAQWLARFEGTIYRVMAAEHFEKAGDFVSAAEQYDMALTGAKTRRAFGEIESLTIRSKAARDQAQKAINNG